MKRFLLLLISLGFLCSHARSQSVILARGPIHRPAPPPEVAAAPRAPLQFLRALPVRGDAVPIDFSPDGKTLALTGVGVELWSVQTGRLNSRLVHGELPALGAAIFSPTAPLLATDLGEAEAGGHKMVFWSTKTGRIVQTLHDKTGGGLGYGSFTFSPDGKVLAAEQGNIYADKGKENYRITLWSVKTGKLLRKISTQRVNSLAFSPDGKLLAAGYQNKIRLWSATSGKLVRELDAPGEVNAVAFSPDGKILARVNDDYSGWGGNITLWNVASGQLLHAINPNWYDPSSLLFAPDGQTLIVGGGSVSTYSDNKEIDPSFGVINFYSISSGQLKSTLRRTDHGGPIYNMALAPDGKTLATSEYGTQVGKNAVKLWRLQ